MQNLPRPFAAPELFLRGLFAAAVAAVHPRLCLAGKLPTPPARGRTIVVGGGKGAAAMAAAVEAEWQGEIGGLVVVPDGYACPTRHVDVVTASHPLPDARSVAAAEAILHRVAAARPDDLVLCLLSGGASAVMAAPVPGLTLEDKRAITATLLRHGARIDELNCVRKHLSRIKGGRLARAAAHTGLVTVVISDVVGDDPGVIASGPTVADPTTCADALEILTRHHVALPEAARAGLVSGAFETPKQLPVSALTIVARPRDALNAAKALAREAGLAVFDLGDACEGYADAVARAHADLAARIVAGHEPVAAPCLILSGGELTVRVGGGGRGGPNTEYALALTRALAPNLRPRVWALAADTDGVDGTAGAAGAIVTPETLARAGRLAPAAFLADNNSAGFFRVVDGLVESGPTLTNVNDFRAILLSAHDPTATIRPFQG